MLTFVALLTFVAMTVGEPRPPDCCDNWEPFFEPVTTACKACQEELGKDDKGSLFECLKPKWYPLNAEGNLDGDKYTVFMTDAEEIKGGQERIDELSKNIGECTKNGAKTREEFGKVDECIFGVYRMICPEADKKLKEQEANEYFRGCR